MSALFAPDTSAAWTLHAAQVVMHHLSRADAIFVASTILANAQRLTDVWNARINDEVRSDEDFARWILRECKRLSEGPAS